MITDLNVEHYFIFLILFAILTTQFLILKNQIKIRKSMEK